MGTVVEPARLTESGERCLKKLAWLASDNSLPVEYLVTSAVTFIEAHYARILAKLIVLSDIQENSFGAALLAELEQDIFQTWGSHNKWLKSGFEIPLADDRPTQDFGAVVDVRNAIIHGESNLTPRQRTSLTKTITLKRELSDKLHVRVSGIQLRFDAATPSAVLRVARDFVTHLDQRVLEKYPQAARL